VSKIKKAGYLVAGAVASAAIASKIMKKKAEKTVLHFFLGDFNKRTNLHRSATA